MTKEQLKAELQRVQNLVASARDEVSKIKAGLTPDGEPGLADKLEEAKTQAEELQVNIEESLDEAIRELEEADTSLEGSFDSLENSSNALMEAVEALEQIESGTQAGSNRRW